MMKIIRKTILLNLIVLISILTGCINKNVELPETGLVLSSYAQKEAYFDAVGRQAMILGRQKGTFDVWMPPLRIIKNGGIALYRAGSSEQIDIETVGLVREPECTKLAFFGDGLTGEMTFFCPLDFPGAVLFLRLKSFYPLKIECRFDPALMLMWPAEHVIGATDSREEDSCLLLSDSTRSFWGVAGSPDAEGVVAGKQGVIRILGDPADYSKKEYAFIFTGSVSGRAEARNRYKYLASSAVRERKQAENYYVDFLENTLQITTPEPALDEAFTWAKIAVEKGFMKNSALGSGLVAGFGLTGNDARPGFPWFFGRDALWTIFALNGYSRFDIVKPSLELLRKNQRKDGKIMHELAQSAPFVDWGNDYPYYYHCADSSPLYILAVCRYAEASGDISFLRDSWASLERAYQYLKTADADGNGFPENSFAGHGWVEGGSLYPLIHEEIYLAGLWTASLESLMKAAGYLYGKNSDVSQKYEKEYEKTRDALQAQFYDWRSGTYAFCRKPDGSPAREKTVMPAVGAWFNVFPEETIIPALREMNAYDISTDWGTRILSSASLYYDPSAYHAGTVWPLFTGWVSTAQFKYGLVEAGLTHLLQNAMLSAAQYPGCLTEELNGDLFQPGKTSVQHQIWSSAMVINPVVHGLAGISYDAIGNLFHIAPEVPFMWNRFEIKNFLAGGKSVSLFYENTGQEIQISGQGFGGYTDIQMTVHLPQGAKFLTLSVDGLKMEPEVKRRLTGTSATVRFAISKEFTAKLKYRGGVTVSVPFSSPSPGSETGALKLIKQELQGDSLFVTVEGMAGKSYYCKVNTTREITGINGGILEYNDGFVKEVGIRFPLSRQKQYIRKKIVLRFKKEEN